MSDAHDAQGEDTEPIHRVILRAMGDVSDDQVDTALSEAARAFLATYPDEERATQWLHEARDYMVRYAWSSEFWISAIGAVIGPGRSFPPPPEEDDFPAWRKRWETWDEDDEAP